MDKITEKKWTIFICLMLVLAVLAVFYQVYNFDFINYDDSEYVYGNPNIQNGITPQSVKWAFTTGYAANWHPLTWFSHMLDWQFFGDNAGAGHIINLIFHIANTLLLFIVLKQMTSKLWQSAFVAALFALHPLHVESVVWVAERKDVLSTFFWILTIWAYAKYAQRIAVPATAKQPRHSNSGAKQDYLKQPRHSNGGAKRDKRTPCTGPGAKGYYLLVIVFFALGLMAKPMLVTLPFVLLLLDYWPLERFSVPRQSVGGANHVILEKIPLFILSAASSIITFLIQRSSGAVVTTTMIPLQFRISNVLISYVKYMGKMIWPSRLAVFYPSQDYSLAGWQVIGALLLLLTISVLVFRLAWRRKYLFTGWFWYLGTLVPVIGIVQVGAQAMADRYAYITLTGLFIIIAWGLGDLLAGWKYEKITIVSSAILIILAISICTYSQLRYWRNGLTLFQHALEVTENNHIAHLHIAKYMCDQGKFDEGIEEYEKYLQMKPDDADVRSDVGAVLCQQGRLDEGIYEYKKYLQIKPDNPNVLNDIGVALSRQKKFDEALEYFNQSLKAEPDFVAAYVNMGYVFINQKNPDKAVEYLEKALELCRLPEQEELKKKIEKKLNSIKADKP